MNGNKLDVLGTAERYMRCMRRALFLLVVIGVTCGLSTTASSTNVIVNPGFESGSMDPWVIGANWCGGAGDGPCSPWQISSSDFHTGNSSLEDMGDVEAVQFFSPTPGSMITDASFWLKQDPAMMFGYELFYSDEENSFNVIMPSDTNWNYCDITSSIDPNGMLYGIGFVNYSGSDATSNGPAWLDDVVIDSSMADSSASYVALDSSFAPQQTTEPSSIVLLVGGLALLGTRPKIISRK